MVVSTHDGQVYEDETSYLLNQPMGDKMAQNTGRSPEGFSDISPEDLAPLRDTTPFISHKDPDWERGAPAVQELLDIPQSEYDKDFEGWKQLEKEGKAYLPPGSKPTEAGIVQMRKNFPATQDYLNYIKKYNPQDVDAYDAGESVIFRKRPSAPPLVGQSKKIYFVRHGDTDLNKES